MEEHLSFIFACLTPHKLYGLGIIPNYIQAENETTDCMVMNSAMTHLPDQYIYLQDPLGPTCYTWVRSQESSRDRRPRSSWNVQQILPSCPPEGRCPQTHTRHRHGMLSPSSCSACVKGFQPESAPEKAFLRPSTHPPFVLITTWIFNDNPFTTYYK